MKTIHIFKADQTLEDEKIENVQINISHGLPKLDNLNSLEEVGKFHEEQAKKIADALFQSLPQGTFDRLAMELFSKKISIYRGLANKY